MKNDIWVVTGASQGLGLSLVLKLLENGFKVCAASRNKEKLISMIGFETKLFLPYELDVCDETQIADLRKRVLCKFGSCDVLVNNAGYSQRGMIEEVSDIDARNNFDINVFGVANMLRAFVPVFREKREGYIINVSSLAGFNSTAGSGIYGASKYAVEGLSGALRKELEPLGIYVTSLKPGGIRTPFLKMNNRETVSKIADYQEMSKRLIKKRQDTIGNENGDPDKVAVLMIELSKMQKPPLHMFAGSDSLKHATDKLLFLENEFTQYEELSRSVDIDNRYSSMEALYEKWRVQNE